VRMELIRLSRYGLSKSLKEALDGIRNGIIQPASCPRINFRFLDQILEFSCGPKMILFVFTFQHRSRLPSTNATRRPIP
jgi:hypothetical protein